jgi:hypothetical protein
LKQPQYASPPILKQDGNWARIDQGKAERFAEHLEKVFTPNHREINLEEERKIYENLDKMQHQTYTLGSFTKNEVKTTITKHVNAKKAPRYDFIMGKILKELPKSGVISYATYLTQLFNVILRIGIFPQQWKVTAITMILKPGKDPIDVKSYRPISLLYQNYLTNCCCKKLYRQ